LQERLVDSVGDLLVAATDPGAELAPHEPERGIANAILAPGVELSLMMVEVPGGGPALGDARGRLTPRRV
jgi:hypothetical protein